MILSAIQQAASLASGSGFLSDFQDVASHSGTGRGASAETP